MNETLPFQVKRYEAADSDVRFENAGWGVRAHVPNGLFNPTITQQIYRKEKPWHRLAAEMAAAGHTVMEISSALGRSRRSIQTVLAQPFANKVIVEKAAMNASEEIRAILEKVAPESVRRIEKLATEAESEQVRLAADREILDRFLGKPTQPIKQDLNVDPDKMSDADLDAHLKAALAKRSGPLNPSNNGHSHQPIEQPATTATGTQPPGNQNGRGPGEASDYS